MSNTGQLIHKLMLVKFSVSYDTGYRSSDQMCETLSSSTSTDVNRIRSGFSMFDKHVISPFTTAISQARQHYTMSTLPWEERGWRVVPVNKWQDIKDELDNLISNVKEKYEQVFNTNYDQLKDAFDEAVGDLEIEFPSKGELEDRFICDYDIGAIASCDDIRIQGIDQIERSKIRDDMKKQYETKFNSGLNDLANRLVTAAEDISVRASDPEQKGKKYTKSLSNITELADTVEGLNITGNEAISEACSQIRENISVYSADAIKTTPVVRKEVVNATANIKEQLSCLEF